MVEFFSHFQIWLHHQSLVHGHKRHFQAWKALALSSFLNCYLMASLSHTHILKSLEAFQILNCWPREPQATHTHDGKMTAIFFTLFSNLEAFW